MTQINPRLWAVVPAAGCGLRMQTVTPKQYLMIHDKTVIEHAINALLAFNGIECIMVALDPNDQCWANLDLSNHPKIQTVQGDAHRCESVLNGLSALQNKAAKDDWVLVHDAVRPCLSLTDINALVSQVDSHPVGGLLGAPLTATIKRCNDRNEVINTVERNELWQAFTPQMFRYETLFTALTQAVNTQQWVTDEAAAVEQLGLKPLMVMGAGNNIKITRPNDLAIAEKILTEDLLHEPIY